MRFGQSSTTARARSAAPIGPPDLVGPFNIVLHGNSLFGSDFATHLVALRPGADDVTARVVGGATTAMLEAEFAAQIDPLWNAGLTNVVFVWEGLDHINDFGGTASTGHAAYASYVTTAKAVHPWNVIVCTLIATSEYDAVFEHPTRGNLTPERDGCNALLRADFAGGDGVLDFAASPELWPTCTSTYFVEDYVVEVEGDDYSVFIHINSNGRDVAAAAIDAFLG